jgi:hypothetical protein
MKRDHPLSDYPTGRPIVRRLFNGLLELILTKIVGRYRDVPGMGMHFGGNIEDEGDPEIAQLYQQREAAIERMRSQKIRDWVRKTVWPEEYPASDFNLDIPIEGLNSSEFDEED